MSAKQIKVPKSAPMPPKTKAKAKGRVKAQVLWVSDNVASDIPCGLDDSSKKRTWVNRNAVAVFSLTPEAEAARVEAGAKALWSYYKYEEATSHERIQMSRNWRSVGTGAKDAYRIRAAAFLESLGWPSPSVSAKREKSGVRRG